VDYSVQALCVINSDIQGSHESVLPVKVRFGKSLKAWRFRRGLSQEDLAEKSGLHRTYISDLERGARNTSLESMEKLAFGLNITLAEFFTDEAFGRADPRR
jgi:transcriptional regulator with XRE-family HTH domain